MTIWPYPSALRTATTDILHGHVVADPYRWLEDRSDPRTRQWLRAQGRLADAELATLPGRDAFRRMFRTLRVTTTNSAIKTVGDLRFRVDRRSDDAPWQLQVSDGGRWRAVIDTARLGADAVIRRWQPSPDGRRIAVQVMLGGAEDTTPLFVIDVATGEIIGSNDQTRYTPIAWRENGFYYVRTRSGVYWHRHGTQNDADERILGGDDPLARYQVAIWHDRWLVMSPRRGAAVVSDLDGDSQPWPLNLNVSATEVIIDRNRRILAMDPAEFGAILVADRTPTGWGDWRTLVPPATPSMLRGMTSAHADGVDHLVVRHSIDGRDHITVHDPATGSHKAVQLPGPGTVAAMETTTDPAILALSYTDWLTPLSPWHLDVRTGTLTDAGPTKPVQDVTVHITCYESFDGTEIPLTVLSGKDQTGQRPMLLICYGGFGISVRPGYQPDVLAWVRAGGSMAVAGIRGGGERGRPWHRQGAGPNKPTAFADLHAAADWLVHNGWTRHGQLALVGGSNGGLMAVGAVVQRPDAYAAVAVSGAPLDLVRYERWGLGKAWRDEYGSAADPDGLATLLRISPYHNVDPDRTYPPVLFQTGENDTRVDPLHSRKMVAALQHAGGGPILLSAADGAGHVSAVDDRAERQSADLLAFLAWHVGLKIR